MPNEKKKRCNDKRQYGGKGYNIGHTQIHTLTELWPITQMDLERHFSVFALCLGPFEDLVSLKTNHPLI